MSQVDVFNRHVLRYEEWFERHPTAFQSEVDAIRRLLPPGPPILEIGVGTGRFAAPLGVAFGVDPSWNMLLRARTRGVCAVQGVAEALPLRSGLFSTVLMVTTICFVDDEAAAIEEMYRVLQPHGSAVLGFVDRHSALGQRYQRRMVDNVFYHGARFVGAAEVGERLRRAGFADLRFVQTLRGDPDTLAQPEPVAEGYGKGGFVVVSAIRR